MHWIDYRQLPPTAGGFSDLFFTYVYDFPEVARYYAHDFRENGAYESMIARLAPRSYDRETLATVLAEQNRLFGSSPKCFENISLLRNPTTFAIVTGQQVGLLGGPLYTVFKTITALRLADRLKLKYPHVDFVPVFWLEGEDHDFAEMNSAAVLDQEAKPLRVAYLPGGQEPDRNPGPVGEMVFDETLLQTLVRLESSLQGTEFTAQALGQLRQAYAPGRTFTLAFASWMNALFGDSGLVFLSPNDPRLKRLLTPLFAREVTEFPVTSQMVIARSAELEQKYHAQVKPRPVNLFLFHRGGRYAIEPREHDFSLRGTRHFLPKEEMLKIAIETPELLSPNVVLRPLAQDILLPTLVYVAGPSEVAYHAQLGPVYESLDIPRPIVYPRASASFLEERVVRTMEKYGLDLAAFFEEPDQLTARVLEQMGDVKLDRLFDDTTRLVHDALQELRFAIVEIDQTLQGPMDGVRSKFDANLAVLKEKSFAAQQRRHETALRQLDRSVGALLPGGSLQERELNIIYYLNRYGPDLIRWLMNEIDITGFKHQILSP